MKFNFKKNLIVIILLIIVIFTCAYLYDNKENFQGYTLGHRLNNLFYDNSTSDNPDECILPALMEGGIQKYAIGFTNTNHTYKLLDTEIHYLSKQVNENYNFVKENKYIADNFPEECNCYVKVTGSDSIGNLSFDIVNFDRSLNDCSGVLYFDLSLDITPAPITHNIDILFFNKNNSLFNFVNVSPPSLSNLQAADINNSNTNINIISLTLVNDFANKYYDYLNIGLKFLSSQLYLHNGNSNKGIKVYNFDFALNQSNNNLLPFVNNGTVSFSLSDNDIENNMGISTTQSTSLNNGLESGVYINDVENSNIDANSNNVGNNSNNVYNYPNQLNLEFENSLGRLLNNKRLSQINGHNHIRDHYVNGYIADGDERLLNNRYNNDMWFESAMNSKDNPIINGNNMNNINDLLRSNCSNTLNNNNCLNQNINQCGTDINESCQNNNCCSKINCKENGKNNNNRELKHIHQHSHEKNNEYKGEENNNNEIDDENGSDKNGSDKNGSDKNGTGKTGTSNTGTGGSGNGGGGVFNNGRVGYNKNKAGNLDSNSQVNNNNRMNVNNNGYFNYNNVDSMTNVRPLVADFSKF